MNKDGFISNEDRKSKLTHGCNFLRFETCIDLSEPIKIYHYCGNTKITLENYTKDVALFFNWWTTNVMKDLNGFNGFSNIKVELIEFKVI